MLRWKHGQNLIFYMLDEYNHTKSTLIAPFWYFLSKQLTNLSDPVTNEKYSALHLNEEYYKQTARQSHSDLRISSILAELYFITMKFKTMKEILYQSNKTLNIVEFYGQRKDDFVKCDIDGDEWYISSDYLADCI